MPYAEMPWTRMTDQEAELILEGLDEIPARMKTLILVTTFLVPDTDVINAFRDVIVAATSVERADEILAEVPPL